MTGIKCLIIGHDLSGAGLRNSGQRFETTRRMDGDNIGRDLGKCLLVWEIQCDVLSIRLDKGTTVF